MKNLLFSFFLLLTFSLYGCSSDEEAVSTNGEQPVVEEVEEVSQAETMEEIWASSLEPAEKARRVQEMLARQSN